MVTAIQDDEVGYHTIIHMKHLHFAAELHIGFGSTSLFESLRRGVQELVGEVHVGGANSQVHEAAAADLHVDQSYVLRVHQTTSCNRFVGWGKQIS